MTASKDIEASNVFFKAIVIFMFFYSDLKIILFH